MSSREIELWVDQRWYDALEKQLDGGSVEQKMAAVFDELTEKLIPKPEYERIRAEIEQERAQTAAEREASRRFAVFCVTENGEDNCFLVDEPLDCLRAARSLRRCVKADHPSADLRRCYGAARDIAPQEFQAYVAERMEDPHRVTGAFDIDLDRGTFASLDAESDTVKDVCTAAYRADRKQYMRESYYQQRFAECLAGKEQTTQAHKPSAPAMRMEQTMG